MGYTLYKRLSHKIINYFYLQSIVSLYSLLILTCWGCTFCPLSFVGNLVFSPVLFIFLLMSTLIFFTELLGIPNTFLIWPLEQISHIWLSVMRAGEPYAWHIACAQPSTLHLITLAIGGLLIMLMPTSSGRKTIALIGLCASMFWFCKQNTPTEQWSQVPCNNGAVSIIQTAHKTIVIDPGYLGRYASALSFVEYTLKPELIKTYGTQTIDHLVLLAPGTLLFQAIERLLDICTVHHLHVPHWHDGTPSLARAYMRLKQQAADKGTQIHRISNRSLTLMQTKKSTVQCQPLGQQCKKGAMHFPAVCITGFIDKHLFTIYPAQYNGERKQIDII